MWDIKIDVRLTKKMKIPTAIIKKVAMEIKRTPSQKLYHVYNKTVNAGDFKIFIAYQFEDNDVMYVKEAKRTKKKWEPPTK